MAGKRTLVVASIEPEGFISGLKGLFVGRSLCLAIRSSVARKDDLSPLLSLVPLGCVRVEGDEHNWCLALQERLGSLPLGSSRCVLIAMDKSLMFLPVRRWCL